MAPRRLVLVDTSSIFYRAFFALPSTLATKEGLHTNAAYGMATVFRKIFQGQGRRPELAAAVFDAPGPTFRHERAPTYKQSRPPMPKELVEQLPIIDALVDVWRFPRVALPGYEADDVIGTLARRAEAAGLEVLIVSPDKDFAQLVGERVRTFDPFRDVTYDAALVQKKWGVPPAQFVDLLALMGDDIDDIPGVAGIGQKGAAQLLAQHGSVDGIYAHLDAVKGKARAALEAGRDAALLSRELARIDCAVPLDLPLDALTLPAADPAEVNALYRTLEFFSLLDAGESRRAPDAAAPAVRVLATVDEARATLGAVRGPVALFPIYELPTAITGAWLGLALAPAGGPALYLPIAGEGGLGPEAIGAARPLLEDPTVEKWAHDVKQLWLLARRHEIALAGVRLDTHLASYLVDPVHLTPHRLDQLAREYRQELLRPVKELTLASVGAAAARPLAAVGRDALADWAGEQVAAIAQVAPLLAARLDELGLAAHLAAHELPLAPLLGAMELTGVRVDTAELARVGDDLRARLAAREAAVHAHAGHAFNIGSPKQLATVLFEELALPVVKRTKTGYSTDQEVLERLAPRHPIAAEVLEHRKLAKLLNTYIDVLGAAAAPPVSPDGRVHATWQQAASASGRIIATDPDLQRTPIRTDEGVRIRRAFVADPGFVLLSADWSQIELRILAHVSADPLLVDSFARGVDVHRRTAGQLFHVAPEAVTDAQRAVGKTVNFATIYGQGATALGQILGIPRKEAQAYIEGYFTAYAGVRAWLDATIEEAHRTGAVTTLLGRRRPIPELSSRDETVRQQGERMAANTPIQGSAADLCKSAMLEIARRLDARRLGARLVMQIHDELVLEVPAAEADETAALVKDVMEHAAPLRVPLVVEVGVGPTWADAH